MTLRDQSLTRTQFDALTDRLEIDLEAVFKYIHGEVMDCIVSDPEETISNIEAMFIGDQILGDGVD